MKINNAVQVLSNEIGTYYNNKRGPRHTGYKVLRDKGLLQHPERLAKCVVTQTSSGNRLTSLVCRVGHAVGVTNRVPLIWAEEFDIGLWLMTVALESGLYEVRRANGDAPSSPRSREPYYVYAQGSPSAENHYGYLRTGTPFPHWSDNIDEDGRQLVYSSYQQPEVHPDSEWVQAVHHVEGIGFQVNPAMLEVATEVGVRTSNPTKMMQQESVLSTATGLLGEVFYHRVHLDERSRLYLSRSPLSFQQGDLSRGLIEFAKGVPLTAQGIDAIHLHIANCNGIKGDLKTRIQFSKDNHDTWIEYAEGLSDGWLNASDPWQLLRACIELATVRVGDLSHIIIPIDQSCSGLAWQSIVMNDATLAKLTNLRGEYHDLYSAIAEQLDIPASASEKRQIVKRSVMPKSYGGGTKTIAKDLRVWALLNPNKAPYLNSLNTGLIPNSRGDYLPAPEFNGIAQSAIDALETTAPATKAYADALKRFYRSRLESGLADIRWLSPSGFPVRIRKEKCDRILGELRLSTGRIALVAHPPTGELDLEGMVRSSLANFIHSLDASLVHKTLAHSPHSIVPVHDSFGSHASNVFDTQKLLMGNLSAIEQQDPSLSLLAQDYDSVTWSELKVQDEFQNYIDKNTTDRKPVVIPSSQNAFS